MGTFRPRLHDVRYMYLRQPFVLNDGCEKSSACISSLRFHKFCHLLVCTRLFVSYLYPKTTCRSRNQKNTLLCDRLLTYRWVIHVLPNEGLTLNTDIASFLWGAHYESQNFPTACSPETYMWCKTHSFIKQYNKNYPLQEIQMWIYFHFSQNTSLPQTFVNNFWV